MCGLPGQNRVWLETVRTALDLPAWMPVFALRNKARLWEPRRLRLRLFTTAGRRRILRLADHRPWTREITSALEQLALLPTPAERQVHLPPATR
jgi:hypothetical protein